MSQPTFGLPAPDVSAIVCASKCRLDECGECVVSGEWIDRSWVWVVGCADERPCAIAFRSSTGKERTCQPRDIVTDSVVCSFVCRNCQSDAGALAAELWGFGIFVMGLSSLLFWWAVPDTESGKRYVCISYITYHVAVCMNTARRGWAGRIVDGINAVGVADPALNAANTQTGIVVHALLTVWLAVWLYRVRSQARKQHSN